MFKFLTKIRARHQTAKALYQTALAQARTKLFFQGLGVPDTISGRFEATVLHGFLVWNRLRTEGADGARLAQAVFDVLFVDMDRSLRLAGVGDLAIPHHMKRMMRGFKGRAMAYKEGLENPDDPDVLMGAIRRNLFGTVAEPDENSLRWFAEYTKAAAVLLAAQPWHVLAQGKISFAGLIDEQESTGRSPDPRMVA